MACSCQKNRKQFEVVDADGQKVLFTSSSGSTANSVAKRYKGATVREKGKTAATTA
jgi:hypothetical protein